MTTLTEANFVESLASFRKFLDDQGERGRIVWTFLEDVYSRKTETFERDFWIKLPTPSDNENFAMRAFALAQKRNVGLGFSAYARCEDGLCCTLIIPADDEDAQYLMMSANGIRFSLVHDMPTAHTVKSGLRWFLFRLLPFVFKRGNYIVYLLERSTLSVEP